VKITAVDASGGTDRTYSGPLALTDTSGTAVFGPVAWSNGVGTTTVTVPSELTSDTVEATDQSGSSATGQSAAFAVIGALDHFKVTASPANGSLATPATVTVTPEDALGDRIDGFAGPVTAAVAAGSAAFSSFTWAANGVGKATATFATLVKGDSITVTDGTASGTSGALNRYGVVASFKVSVSPASIAPSGTLTVKTTALDTAGNVVADYAGPVVYSDLSGRVAAGGYDQAWTNGVGVAHLTVTGSAAQAGDHIVVQDGAVNGESGAFKIT
jgi:hypothetical protein